MVVLKAMGMASDQEIVQMVGMDPTYADLLAPSIQECAALGIFTQQQALEYCGAKVKTGRQMWVKTKRHKVGPVSQSKTYFLMLHLRNESCFPAQSFADMLWRGENGRHLFWPVSQSALLFADSLID